MHNRTITSAPAKATHPPNQTQASTIGMAMTAVSHRWPRDCPCPLSFFGSGASDCEFCSVALCTRLLTTVQTVAVVDSSYSMLHVNLLVQNQAREWVSHNTHYRPTATAGSC